MPKISVIVPVYNTAKYLDRCLDSVVCQTFTDIEILCVDDCSPDNSIEILQRYAERDARVKIFRHSENLGLGGARNTAIKQAQAPYLASVDSDDLMLPHMLETLWNATEDQTVDIVVCGYERVDEDKNVLDQIKPGNRVYLNHDYSINIFETMNPAFWNKLWRKELYTANNIYFPNYIHFQDLATTPRILAHAKTIKKIDDVLYQYTQRLGSTTFSRSSKHLFDYLTTFQILYEFLQSYGLLKRYGDSLEKGLGDSLVFHANNVLASQALEQEKAQHLRGLLVMRMAFLEYYDSVTAFDTQAILPLLRLASSKLFLERQKLVLSETLPISLIVKTLEADKKIKRRMTYKLFRELAIPFLSKKRKKLLRKEPTRFFEESTNSFVVFVGRLLCR